MILKQTIFIALIFIIQLYITSAQQYPREWILSLHSDITKYYGDFTDDRFQSGGTISVKHLYKILDQRRAIYFDLSVSGYELNYKTTAEMIQTYNNSSEIKIGEVNRTFIAPVQFQMFHRWLIGPNGELFLGGGVELSYYQPYNHNGYPLPKVDDYGKWFIGVPFSAQFEYMLSDVIALNFHSTLHLTFTDHLDGTALGNSSDHYLTAGIGISYSFPAPDRDSDFDGLTDREEIEIYHTNPSEYDTDHDGLSDGEEVKVYHTNPLNPDTDGDGLLDGDEVHKYHSNPLEIDTDGDGLTDAEEVSIGTSPWRADTDGDGLNDKIEIARGTDPLNRDTDGDGIPDGMEANSSPLLRDTDGDGLPDQKESEYGLRPYDEDFDNDGLSDGLEIEIGTDPKKADTDNDGVSDYAEYYGLMTDPRNPDTDGDGIPDGQDPDPLGTGVNPQKNVMRMFEGLFRHEHKVDETSKALIILIHLIRSASPGHVREIEIDVYGETEHEASDRRDNLNAYLQKQTVTWGAPFPHISVYSFVKPIGYAHAKLMYIAK